MASSETIQPIIVKPESKGKEVQNRNYVHIMVKAEGGERERKQKEGKDNYKDNRKKKCSR